MTGGLGSTNPLEEAELVVVGAGPAGSSCAARAAERGLDVVMVDQDDFPRDKACGDGVTSGGVTFLERLGLESVLREGLGITGARLVLSHSYELETGFTSGAALCIPRKVLDEGLLNAATARGARFLKGRVNRVLGSPPRLAVEVKTDSGTSHITARRVVATDGATSRLRRLCGLSPNPTAPAYAVRQYVETERALDPVFEIHVPIVFDDRTLMGYGWLFPLGGRLANVGVGFMRYPPGERSPPLTAVLSSFIDGLRTNRPLGRVTQVGRPMGSPVASNFSADRCEWNGLLFGGDAAQTVDPFTGEGITQALLGGELIADITWDSLRAPHRRPQLGPVLNRRFPRLGADLRLPLRLARQLLDGPRAGASDDSPQSTPPAYLPLLREIAGLVGRSDVDPSIQFALVTRFLTGEDPVLAESLEAANETMLDALVTELPLATDLLAREFRDRLGPVRATTCLLVEATVAGKKPTGSTAAGLALEAARLADRMLAAIPPGSGNGDPQVDTNSALASSLGAFSLSCAAGLAGGSGASALGRIATAIEQVSLGRFLEIEDLFDVDRSPERYFQAARHRADLFEAAAHIGARLGGAAGRNVSRLAVYGRELGLAIEIAEDLHALLNPSETGRRPGSEILRGAYTLPVVYALRDDSRLRERLSSGALASAELANVVDAIAATDGIARAVWVCQHHTENARREVANVAGCNFDRLARFANLIANSAQQWAP
jgi:geranylgeranyl reductase family protein